MAKLTPYLWQTRDQDILRAGNWTGLVAIEAGGGKSLTATLAIGEAKPRVTLIIAPKSTHHTAWLPTLRDNLGVEARIIGNDNKATKTALADYLLGYEGVFISSPQFVTRSDVAAWCGDMLIVDEVHMAGANTPKSKLQRKLSGYTPTEARTALNTRFAMRLALSATPMRSDFANIWGVTRLLWPELCYRGEVAYDNFAGFQADRQEWIEVVTGYTWENTGISLSTPYHSVQARFGSADDLRLKKGDEGTWLKGKPKKARKYLHEKIPGQLMSELPTLVMHKRRERCCDDPSHVNGFLPVDEPQIIERTVELTAKQRKAIQQMNDLMMTYLASSPLIAEIPLTAKMRIRQLTLGEADATSVMVQTEDLASIQKDQAPFFTCQ